MTTHYRLHFEIHHLPKMPNELLGAPFYLRAGNAKNWFRWVQKATNYQWPKTPLQVAKLTMVRRSSVEPDFDGLVGSFKPVIDSLVKLLIIANDKRENVGIPEYRWEKASPGKGSVVITVEQVHFP